MLFIGELLVWKKFNSLIIDRLHYNSYHTMKVMKIGSFISGKEHLNTGGGSVEVINPATGEIIAHESCCDAEWVDKCVVSAQNSFDSNDWQNLTAADRGYLLYKLSVLVEESAELAKLELLDTGKPLSQIKTGEIPLTASILRFYAGAADKIEGRVKSTSDGAFHITSWEPYGVVAGILPWNYPLINVAMKVAPALAAGNAIVVKPSVETPLSAIEFGKLCIEAGIPAGIVNILLGKGSVSGNHLVEHPKVKKISFTGSTNVGKAIQIQATEDLKAVNLELGGKNAIIVFEDANLEKAADAVLYSAFVNTGQLCVSCSRLLVQESIQVEFEKLLLEKLLKIGVGDPENPDILIGPMITKSQFDIAIEYIHKASAEGCKIIAGGKVKEMGNGFKNGFWLEPTIVSGAKPNMKVASEEIFGPVLSVISFKDEEEAIAISNSVIYGLSGSVWTSNGSRSMRLIKSLKTGIIWVNSMLSGYPQIPVPPKKMSGTGVELGIEGLMAYCKLKSAVMGYDESAPVGWDIK